MEDGQASKSHRRKRERVAASRGGAAHEKRDKRVRAGGEVIDLSSSDAEDTATAAGGPPGGTADSMHLAAQPHGDGGADRADPSGVAVVASRQHEDGLDFSGVVVPAQPLVAGGHDSSNAAVAAPPQLDAVHENGPDTCGVAVAAPQPHEQAGINDGLDSSGAAVGVAVAAPEVAERHVPPTTGASVWRTVRDATDVWYQSVADPEKVVWTLPADAVLEDTAPPGEEADKKSASVVPDNSAGHVEAGPESVVQPQASSLPSPADAVPQAGMISAAAEVPSAMDCNRPAQVVVATHAPDPPATHVSPPAAPQPGARSSGECEVVVVLSEMS